MRISIITVCRNSAATIRDTLESVRCQTYPDVEHLVIDGASDDGTQHIVLEFDHVARLLSEPDSGLYDAMNKGILLATGDLIGILNSDDVYAHSGVLEAVARQINKSGASALYGDLKYVRSGAEGNTVRYWQSGSFSLERFRKGWMPPHPTFFVRKSIYQKLGLYDPAFGTSADYELMLRFLYKNKVSTCYLPEILVHMRTGGLSNRSIRRRLLANRSDRKAWVKNNLKPAFYTLWLKPLRKIPQYLGFFKF